MIPSGGDILLVEDNPHDAEMTIFALRRCKITQKIHHLKDGAQALDFIFKTDFGNVMPKLVLLDLKLPKVSGLEVLEKIRSTEKTRHWPVVMLTSSNEPQDRAACYRWQANSYIVKSVDFPEFMEAIARVGEYWIHLNTSPSSL